MDQDCLGTSLQEVQEATIDQIIGGNLRILRETQHLTLRETADTMAFLTGDPWSEAKLSRWETGRYRFTVTDLHVLSQLHGVNLLALLNPGNDVTHVAVAGRRYGTDTYMYDFFIDPQGTFADRARAFAERRDKGTIYVVDAIGHITDTLNDTTRNPSLADFNTLRLRVLAVRDLLQSANPVERAIADLWVRDTGIGLEDLKDMRIGQQDLEDMQQRLDDLKEEN